MKACDDMYRYRFFVFICNYSVMGGWGQVVGNSVNN